MTLRTIRQTAATGILPEFRLRQMQKQGRLPGVYSGNRFLVNVDMLTELLQNETKQSIKQVGTES